MSVRAIGCSALVTLVIVTATISAYPQGAPKQQTIPSRAPLLLHLTRSECPVRLGGVFLWGLGNQADPLFNSAKNAEQLSSGNRDWIAANCDVTALPSVCLTAKVYPWIVAKYPAFTGLLYLYASCLYSTQHFGSAGVWDASMTPDVLHNSAGEEVPFPGKNGHWMDFGSGSWARYWKKAAEEQCAKYDAQGVVAAELPVNNTFVTPPQQYARFDERADATARWLETAHDPAHTLLIPAALDFERPADSATLPPTIIEPQLQGTLWDAYFPLIDGAWLEGFARPYWSGEPIGSHQWEIQMEAMDRYGEAGQVFVAMAAYSNTTQLEDDLASYLLVVHHQGRAVFQPMPLSIKGHPDAGYSLAVLRQQVLEYPGYFNVPLGRPIQVRHMVPDGRLNVWVRKFQHGVVYFNSDDRGTLSVNLGSAMRRMNGSLARRVTLPPMGGVVLLYSQNSITHD